MPVTGTTGTHTDDYTPRLVIMVLVAAGGMLLVGAALARPAQAQDTTQSAPSSQTSVRAAQMTEAPPAPEPSLPNHVFLPLVSTAAGVDRAQIATPDIIGGREAIPGAWPWQVALVADPADGRTQFCGGSLIAPDWVLTAAHCVDWWNPATTLHVVTGRHRMSGNDGTVTPVARIIVHPHYNAQTFDSDLALLHLARAVSSQPVGIEPVTVSAGTTATVTGWGRTVDGVPESKSDVLRQVEVPTITNQACNASYPNRITDNMLCAGRAGLDACQGDSGGSLVIPHTTGPGWTQIGVVSWGIGCARDGYPGIYTRVARFDSWIQTNLAAGTVTADDYEPDDTRRAAKPYVDGERQRHNIHVAGDEDWSRFTATAGAAYTVETLNLGASADTTIELYDGAGALLMDNDDGGDGYASRLNFTAGAAGTYAVRVRHYDPNRAGAGTDYELRIVQGPIGGAADSHEPDNGAPEAGNIASDGTVQTHDFHVAGDEDWLQVSATAGVTYVAETSGLSANGDTFMALYDRDENQLAMDDDGGAGLASRLVFTAGYTGVYYLRVQHYNGAAFGAGTQYDIRVLVTDAGGAGDAYEPDNGQGEASTIPTTGVVQTHTIHRAGDEDWLAFTATAGTYYVVETTNLGAEADTILHLYDETRHELAVDDDGGEGRGSRIGFTAGYSGPHYVRVVHYSVVAFGPATHYDVGVSAGAASPYEPDNSAAAATLIASDGTVQTHDFHVAGDEDWLLVSATAGVTYVAETSGLGANGDTFMALYDRDENQLAMDDDGGAGLASRLVFTAGYTGVYYLRVQHYNGAAFGAGTQYDIRVLVTDAGGAGDAYEPDNGQGEASTIPTTGVVQTHTIHRAGDEDWLAFTATAGTYYVVETTNLGAEADTILHLYDETRHELAVDDDGGEGRGSRIGFTAGYSGPHYVRVVHYSVVAFGPATQYDIGVRTLNAVDAIENPGFERGAEDWGEYSLNSARLIYRDTELDIRPHGGEQAVWLGGIDDELAYVFQTLTVPDDAYYLHYYHWIASIDECGYDFGGVAVDSYWHVAYELCAEADTGGWVEVSVDMREYAGQTITLAIVASTDKSMNSNLYVDDLSFQDAAVVGAAALSDTAVSAAHVDKVRSPVHVEPGKAGVPIRANPVGTSFLPPSASASTHAVPARAVAAMTGVDIAGPDQGVTHAKVHFVAQVQPKAETATATYVWAPEPISGQGTAEATFLWRDAGKHAVKVAVTAQDGGTADAFHVINIKEPAHTPVTAVALQSSAAETSVDTPISVSLSLTPTTATGYTVIWDPYPEAGQGKTQATFAWSQPGDQTVTVEVVNADGSRTTADTAIRVAGGAGVALQAVTIAGLRQGGAGIRYTYTAETTPANASTPITFTWTPTPNSGQGSARAVYQWARPGTYTINVTAGNGAGSASATHTVEIGAHPESGNDIYLPFLQRH